MTWMSSAAKTASKDSVYFASRSRSKKRSESTRTPDSTARFLACCTVQGPVGWAVIPGDVQPACAVLEEHQRVHPAQIDQVDVDEVAGDDGLGLRGQGIAPCRTAAAWGWIDARRGKDLPDRCRADRVSEPDQFTLNSSTAPTWILPGEPQHQSLHHTRRRRSPGPAPTLAVVPLPGDQLAVPRQQRPRRHREHLRPPMPGDQRGQRCEPQPVRMQ